MTHVAFCCTRCKTVLEFDEIHTGFNNTGYAYCDVDGALLVWETFDAHYVGIVGDRHPWMLDGPSRASVEADLAPCPCGGHFGMANPPRCTGCAEPLTGLLPSRIYFADFGQRFDPTRDGLWI